MLPGRASSAVPLCGRRARPMNGGGAVRRHTPAYTVAVAARRTLLYLTVLWLWASSCSPLSGWSAWP